MAGIKHRVTLILKSVFVTFPSCVKITKNYRKISGISRLMCISLSADGLFLRWKTEDPLLIFLDFVLFCFALNF